jgi:diguanylate cyclase (GGDEF)-like protein
MPRLDGLEVITHVRAMAAISNIYAVMLTAHEDVESKVAALTLGYDDLLPKSCTEVEVSAKLVAARRMLSRQRALAAAVTEWHTLATRDELTNVATRRFFTEHAERCLREGRRIAVALFDLDHFKQVNDTFGHPTGDRILRDVGALFIDHTRSGDVIARYGGDEFVLLIVGVSVEEATVVVERLASSIAGLQWTVGSSAVRVEATTGIAHSTLIPDGTLEQLIEAADRDLYAHKWLRRNPATAPEDVYEYPSTSGVIVPLPTQQQAPMMPPLKRPADE